MTPALRHYRKKAAERRALGLTTKGTRFKRTPNFKTAADRLEARRARGLKHWNKIARKRKLAGLTTRGKPRNLTRLIGRVERILLLDDIEKVTAELGQVFSALPPSAKAASLKLSHALATLRLTAL